MRQQVEVEAGCPQPVPAPTHLRTTRSCTSSRSTTESTESKDHSEERPHCYPTAHKNRMKQNYHTVATTALVSHSAPSGLSHASALSLRRASNPAPPENTRPTQCTERARPAGIRAPSSHLALCSHRVTLLRTLSALSGTQSPPSRPRRAHSGLLCRLCRPFIDAPLRGQHGIAGCNRRWRNSSSGRRRGWRLCWRRPGVRARGNGSRGVRRRLRLRSDVRARGNVRSNRRVR